ncbi:MAG: BMC domain-containing protein [Firmicutes bacterium]|nr:BMC domain-containing protein [Bacillota bacterium]
MYPAIGMVEFLSIAKGIEATDAMLKVAPVDIIEAHPCCSGKYFTIVTGDVDAVQTSVKEGLMLGEHFVMDSFVIPNVSEQIYPALKCAVDIQRLGALGIIETFAAASCIRAADSAAKAADVTLIEIRLSMGLGGKAYVTMTGDVSAVEAAVRAGVEEIQEEGTLVTSVVIPGPHEDINKLLV